VGKRMFAHMCHFITLIAPTDDAAALRAVMERHGRTASLIENQSIRLVLNDREYQYLTTKDDCDCGTALAAPHDGLDSFDKKFAKESARMSDSIELWNSVLHDIGERLKLPYVGIFVRFYSGAIANETFSASRRELPRRVRWNNALASLRPDEVTIFRLS
jgi:hypothetical protein